MQTLWPCVYVCMCMCVCVCVCVRVRAQLSRGRARTISKYKMNTVESERGSLIINLDKVRNQCFFLCLYLCALFFLSLSLSHLCLTSLHRFLTHDQRRSLLGSIRNWKWASYNQLLCLSMNSMTINTVTVSLKDTQKHTVCCPCLSHTDTQIP